MGYEAQHRGTQTRSEIRRLLASHGHVPVHALGQNFLADPNIVHKMVAAAQLNETSKVVEIGAGTGAITVVLAEVAETVVAYEIDTSLKPVLEESLRNCDNVELRFADVTKTTLQSELKSGPWTMVANLPFNVGTGIVLDALIDSPTIEKLVVMVQREVADRLVAGCGTKTYGLPSVICGLYSEGHLAFSVPPQVLDPQPRVESGVVVLDRVSHPKNTERACDIAAAAFGQRRKMLRRSLAGFLTDAQTTLLDAGIEPTARPEQLEPLDFVAIADAELLRQ